MIVIPRVVLIGGAPLSGKTCLARAIARHAWTFAGSGRFGVVDPWTFRIAGNPLIRGERADRPICHWHAAVFARLYQDLVAADCTCIETSCAAEGGRDLCVFEVRRPL